VFDRMLVPLDGSEVSETVIPYAIELAKRCGSKVTLLEAVESVGEAMATMAPAEPVLVTPDATEQILQGLEAEQKAAQEYLTKAAERFKAEGVEAGWVVVAGDPGTEILAYARREGSQVIVMASHGRGGLGRLFQGSVAEHVMHHTGIPVLYVRYEREKHK
jgi:nucleotide-binding universal stress UspA family protein